MTSSGEFPWRSTAGQRRGRRTFVVGLLILLGLLVAGTLWGVLRIRKTPYTFAELANGAIPVKPLDTETIRRIDAFCSDCHGLPRPEEYPRNDWYAMVRNGYSYYAASGRTDLDPPEPHQTEIYYRQRACELPTFSTPEEADTKLKVQFAV